MQPCMSMTIAYITLIYAKNSVNEDNGMHAIQDKCWIIICI